ncbi:AAA family ATPase [Candidatus Woesearchaeota archaeon]|nr:AAA family ATPase [Candidatus Woesearchaeota archaeon]
MRKISVFCLKGGVGKTTTAVNIAAGLARKGKKVLLMDLDSQGSISHCLESEYPTKDMFHLIANGAELEECITHMGKDLDLVPSNDSLNDVDEALGNRANKDYILSLKMEKNNSYDYAILDCPPNFGTMTRNALIYSDEVFVPISTDVLGYKVLMKTIEKIEKFNEDVGDEKVAISRIIPTFYDKRLKVSREILNRMQGDFYGIVSGSIMANSKLKEAPKKKCSIFSYAKSSQGAKDYGELVMDIIHNEKASKTERVLEKVQTVEVMNS